jgi:acylphosphatase
VRVRLLVNGRVQGVGFRWFVREAARRRRLAGWVRNRSDGSVELEVEGETAACHEFLATVREGPPGARVDGLQELSSDHGDALPQPFTIIR